MTDEKWIALLGFIITALTLISTFPPAAPYAAWFQLGAALVSAFMATWFGVKPMRAASKLKQDTPADQ